MDDSVYTLIQQTYDSDSAVQERSARALADSDLTDYGPQAIQALCGLLSHEELAVREAAKASLIHIRGAAVVEAVIPYLKGSSTTALNYALEILSHIGADSIDRIVGLLESRDHDVRKFGCDLLGNLQYHDSAYDLIDLLSDPHINVAIAAGEALGKLGSREAVPRLIRALQYPDSWMRCIAAEALGNIGDSRAVDAFLAVPGDEEPMVLYGIMKALGMLRDPRGIAAILTLLRQNDAFASTAFQALEQLVHTGGAPARDAFREAGGGADLMAFLDAASPNVVRHAARLAAEVPYPEAVPLLERLRTHEDPTIAAAAQSALQQLATSGHHHPHTGGA